jgi:PAS domain S-box-containing protein
MPILTLSIVSFQRFNVSYGGYLVTLNVLARYYWPAFALLDGTMDGIFMFHPETLIFSYVNKGAVLQTGYSEEELLKMSPLDINPVFDEKRFRELLSPLLMNDCPALKFTTVHQRKNGEDMPVEAVLQHLKVSANRS